MWKLCPLALVASIATTTAGFAQSGILDTGANVLRTGSLSSIPGDWTITVGVQGKVGPEFQGSKDFSLDPLPIFSIRRAGQNPMTVRFRSPRDSASIALLNTEGFFAGPALKFRSARNASDHEALRGLGDVDWTLEVGGFAEYWPQEWLRTRVEVRHGFNGHEGVVADASADVVVPFAERWILSGGPRLTLASTKATAPYFGIDAAQALTSGLPEFDAKGGVQSVGAGFQVRHQLTNQWATRTYVEYDRLMGDAASSPLVTERGSPNQLTFGVGVTYSFDIKLW